MEPERKLWQAVVLQMTKDVVGDERNKKYMKNEAMDKVQSFYWSCSKDGRTVFDYADIDRCIVQTQFAKYAYDELIKERKKTLIAIENAKKNRIKPYKEEERYEYLKTKTNAFLSKLKSVGIYNYVV